MRNTWMATGRRRYREPRNPRPRLRFAWPRLRGAPGGGQAPVRRRVVWRGVWSRWSVRQTGDRRRPIRVGLGGVLPEARGRGVLVVSRRCLWEEQGGRCWYCEQPFSSRLVTIDHVLPRVLGGTNAWHNIVASCAKCNRRKGCKRTKKVKTLRRINALRAQSGLEPMTSADLGASVAKGETASNRDCSLAEAVAGATTSRRPGGPKRAALFSGGRL